MSGRKSPPPLYFSLTSQPGGELQPKDLSGNLAEDRVLHSLRDRYELHLVPYAVRESLFGAALLSGNP